MKTYALWMDMDQAKVVHLSQEGTKIQVLKRDEMKHHTCHDPENHKNCEKFFHQIAGVISDAKEILLMGPGLAKDHFKKHLGEHHHQGLAKSIVGTLSVEHMSDGQLMNKVHQFFKEYSVFHSSVSA